MSELIDNLREEATAISYAVLQSRHGTDVQGQWATLMNYAADRIEELDAQLAQRWQPIETAPKDGTEVLVARCSTISCNVATSSHWKFAVSKWHNGSTWFWHGPIKEPTHWMPLPEPPEQTP